MWPTEAVLETQEDEKVEDECYLWQVAQNPTLRGAYLCPGR